MYRLCVVITFVYNFFVAGILTDAQNSFISKSVNLTTLIGETVEFNCFEYNTESLKYTTELTWLKNEKSVNKIIRKYPHKMSFGGYGNILTIINVTQEDAGTYKCNTFNQSHNDYSIYTLTVNGLPKPTTHHMTTYNHTKSIGGEVNIRCMGYMYYDPDNHKNQHYTYFKDGTPLFLNESNERMWVDEDSNLQIKNLTNGDKGTYKCLWFKDERSQKHRYNVILNKTVHLNDKFGLECDEKTWFKNDIPFISSKENTHVKFYNNDSKFYIDNLTFEDAGTYRCNTSDEYSTFNYFILNIIDPLEKLSFTLFTSNISVVFGETIQLKCHIFQSTIHYTTWYSWKKNGEPVVINNKTNNIYFKNNQSVLEISNLTSNDIGNYECEAESYYHKVYSSYTLIIADVQNSFISKSINRTTLVGETVEFNCSEYNMESLKYTTQLIWYKNEEPLRNIIKKNSNRIFLDASGDTLTITNVTKEDTGTYKCNIFNQLHNDYSIYTLAVNGRPVETATDNQLKKNNEQVNSIWVYLAFIELFILIGCVTICCIWWLRRRQTTG